MSDKIKVKFARDWRYAHHGHTVVSYAAGEENFLSPEAFAQAKEEKVLETKKVGPSVEDLQAELQAAGAKVAEAEDAAQKIADAHEAEKDPAKKSALEKEYDAAVAAHETAVRAEKEAKKALEKAEKQPKK